MSDKSETNVRGLIRQLSAAGVKVQLHSRMRMLSLSSI